MEFYTAIVKESMRDFTALCLENGLMATAESPRQALEKLQEALASLDEALESGEVPGAAPLATKDFHAFLSQDGDPAGKSWRVYVLRRPNGQEG